MFVFLDRVNKKCIHVHVNNKRSHHWRKWKCFRQWIVSRSVQVAFLHVSVVNLKNFLVCCEVWKYLPCKLKWPCDICGLEVLNNLLTVQYFLDFADFLYPQHLPAWLSNEIICKDKIIDDWEMASNFYWQINAHYAPRTLYLMLTNPGSDLWFPKHIVWIWFTLTKKTKCDSNILFVISAGIYQREPLQILALTILYWWTVNTRWLVAIGCVNLLFYFVGLSIRGTQ